MAWKFVLADLNGTNIGEPRATGRTLTVGVSTVEQAGFQILDSDNLWDQVVTGATTLKVFDSAGNLQLYGPVIADEEVGSGQGANVKVTAPTVAWNLGKRFTGRDLTGVGTVYTSVDPATIISGILTAINADQPTGVTIGTVDTFFPQTVTYLWKKVLDALNELGAIDGSYEWGLSYTDGAPPTCQLNLRSTLGTDRRAEVFLEYGAGTRHNCQGYSRRRTLDNAATRVWTIGSGPALVSQAFDATAELTGRYEDVISYGGITDTTLLAALATANVAVRKQPQTVVTLTPFPALAPLYGVDWFVGDRVSARVVVNDTVRVSGVARIWGADIAIDEAGNETATIRLVPS